MTLGQIKYILEIANTGSINRAAANLFISQSVLSTSVKRLEDEVGRQIFFRTSKGVRLTPFGQQLLSYLKPIQLQLNQLDSLVSNSGSPSPSTLSVATNGYQFIDELVCRLYYKYRHQGIRFELYEDYGASAVDMVANRVCEVCFIRIYSCYKRVNMRQITSLGLEYYPLVKQDITITVGEHNPFYNSERSVIEPAELAQFPAIMYDCMDTGPYADIFNQIGIPAGSSRIVVNSRAALYTFLRDTDGYYLNSTRQDMPDNHPPRMPVPCKRLYLRGCSVTSELGWVKRSGGDLSAAARELVNSVAEFFSDEP